jgi:microcystin-dependent protein
MAVTYVLGENPIWYFTDLTGRPLAGGKFYTFSQLNYPQPKFVYSDPNGNFPYPDPVIIDANGTAGPFFFAVDSSNPADTYFLFVTDSQGNEIWTVENYSPGGGGGGGGTTAVNLNNLLTNGVFFRHSDTISSPVPTYSIVAPGNNAALVASTVTTQNPSPHITFLKNNTTATDTITFPIFPLGSAPISGLSSPVDYFNYACTVAGSSETIKCLQFPICAKVQNLSNTQVCGTFWAMANGGTSTTIQLQFMQYFGDGAGASSPVVTPFQSYTLTGGGTWQLLNFSTTVPTVSGKSLGGPNFGGPANNMAEGPNDGLFLQIQFPLDNTCNIGITNFTFYEGTIFSDTIFQTYDEIDSVISLPQTGDVRVSLNSFAPFGWVFCNDGVLSNGNPAIVLPAGIPSARNNADTYALFSLIWNATNSNPSYAPLYDSSGVLLVSRGASALADFSASRQLSLTKALGRAIASQGLANGQSTTWNLSQINVGNESQTLSANNLPAHTHPFSVPFSNQAASRGGGAADTVTPQTAFNGNTGNNSTTNTPVSIMQPTSFWNVFLKL